MSNTAPAYRSAWIDHVRRFAVRLGVLRKEAGWEVVLDERAAPPPRGRTCAVCGAVARHGRAPAAAPALWGRSKPEVIVALCHGCHLRTWRRTFGLVGISALTGAATVLGARAAFLLWPWIPWLVLMLAASALGLFAWAASARLLVRWLRADGREGWQGVPARVTGRSNDGWTLVVASRSLVTLLDQVATRAPVSKEVVESDTIGPLLAWAGCVVLVGTALWLAWHPEVRVVNLTHQTLQVSADGRAVALMGAVPRESPNAGLDVRVPAGRRVLESRSLDGSLVDETVAWVGAGEAHLYAPGAAGRCFRLEQRAYGRALQPHPAVVVLPSDRSFHSLPVAVDAWFQPNPPSGRDLWFSGGVRRALRVGGCEPPGESGSSVPGQR
ncbi:MAG: hypothetical protein ACOC1F_05560 [Myxococcota bacterium]